jgi:hypothetical protein
MLVTPFKSMAESAHVVNVNLKEIPYPKLQSMSNQFQRLLAFEHGRGKVHRAASNPTGRNPAVASPTAKTPGA